MRVTINTVSTQSRAVHSLRQLPWGPGASAPRIVVSILLCVQLAGVVLFAYLAVRTDRFPYPLGYGEGPLLDQAVRLSRLENIYRASLTSPPYVIANYPPLFPLAQVPFVWAFGPAYWYGRLIAQLSALVAALFLSLVVWELTHDRTAATIGGLTLLTIPLVTVWAQYSRTDTLALALSWAGLYCVMRCPGRLGSWLLGPLLLAASAFAKQSFVAVAPCAAVLWLVSQRRRRDAAALAGVLALMGFGLFLFVNSLTNGGFFLNLVTANLNQMSLRLLRNYWGDIVRLMPLFVIATMVVTLLGAWRRTPAGWFEASYIVLAVLTSATAAKVGSDINYFLEWAAGTGLAVGLLMAWSRRSQFVQVGLGLLLALQTAYALAAAPYLTSIALRLSLREEAGRLNELVRKARGPVLADVGMGFLPLNGRPILLQPFEMTQLAAAGFWDESPLIDGIEAKTFVLILVEVPTRQDPGDGYNRWTPRMQATIARQYQVVDTITSGRASHIAVYARRGE